MHTYDYSDPHFGHENIIRFCARPFRDAEDMGRQQMTALRRIDADGHRLICLGDWTFDDSRFTQRWTAPFRYPKRHILLKGNHDKWTSSKLAYVFGTIVGDRTTWETHYLILDDVVDGQPVKVHLSHAPIEDIKGCDWALHGHTHNSATRQPEYHWNEYPWLKGQPRHINVSAEVIDYLPRTLQELVDMRRADPTALY